MALAQPSAPSTSSATGPCTNPEPLPVLDSIGKRVDPVYSQTLHIRVKELLHSSHSGFPGSQPVPFEAKHLTILEREDYFVCEKSDGVRCLLFFTYSTKGPATFMLDRNQIWYYVPNVLFPVRGRDNEYLKDTLMDGEIVVDFDENGNKSHRFLIFDLMASNGQSIIQRSFNTRLGVLQQDVIQSYKHSLRSQSDPPPFKIELKKMERSYGLRLVFDQITKLRHNSDGIIWTPVKCPYVSGICEKLLKWKPPEKNTVDFRINAKWSKDHKPIYTLDVLSHLTYKFFDHFQPDPDWALEWKDQPPDGRIAEFRYDSNWEVTIVEQGYAPTIRTGGWRFVRFRDDKDAANEESDVKKILHSIKDGVSKEQLITHMECIRDAWKAREKGLPPPALAHLNTRGRLSISSTSNQPMVTPTATSPVFPSPAANSFSSSSAQGYFYGDHNVNSRQSSVDYGSGERRSSTADANTDSKTGSGPSDTNNNQEDHNTTQSLPVSRKQSLETSPKRDNNGNDNEETERKRHKSLSELDKARKIQIQTEKRGEEESERANNNNRTLDHSATAIKRESPLDETMKTDVPVNDTTIANHATKTSSLANYSSTSNSLSTVREEDSLPASNSARRRKTMSSGNDLQQRHQQYVDKEDKLEDASDTQLNKHRKVAETRTTVNIKSGSSPTYGNGNELVSNQHKQQAIAPKKSMDTTVSRRNDGTAEATDLSKRYGQPQSIPTGSTTDTIQNGTSAPLPIGQQRNQGSYHARYDPARSPPPSSSSSSSSSIPRSPHLAKSVQVHYGSNLPSSASSSPSLAQSPSSNRKESSHSIHNLLTSSVEPVSYSPKKSDAPTVVTTTHSGRSSSFARPNNLSSLLHDNTPQGQVNNMGYRSNEMQPRHPQQQQYQQIPVERPQTTNIPSHPSSARTPPVQFINFHAERPRAQDSPTLKQKTVFIQGEYHNNASEPPTKSRSGSIATSNTPHQWQPGPGPDTTSSQPSNLKNSNHRSSQASSATSSPSSSPRDSRRSGSYNVWRATGHQQQPSSQPVLHYGVNHPGAPTHHQVTYPAPAHYYHSQQQHQYQQQQQQQYTNYDGSVHSEQHLSHGTTGKHTHHHKHQQPIRPATEPTEYHQDPSGSQHPAYQEMYRPQQQSQYHRPSSPLPPPAKDSEKKSDKAKLDFILN